MEDDMQPVVTGINLDDPTSFRNMTLTLTEAKGRYTILTNQEAELDEQDQVLTPRTARELSELGVLLKRCNTEALNGEFPICRLKNLQSTTPHYFVKIGTVQTNIEKYKEIETHLQEVPKSNLQIVLSIQDDAPKNWFNQALGFQVDAIFRAGFLYALKGAFIADVHLLKASSLLTKEPILFKQVLDLYKDSYELYGHQDAFNRSVQLKILKGAKESYERIHNCHHQILQICGSQLAENPQIHAVANTCYQEEVKASLALSQDLKTSCDVFLNKIAALENSVSSCMVAISNKNEKVVNALASLNDLLTKQQDLGQKKVKVQREFEEFQSRKQKEWASRKEEREGGQEVSILGITIWSKAPTIKISEANFGSADAYQRYLNARNEEEALAGKIESAKVQLTDFMKASGIMQYGQSAANLDQAIGSLSAALASVQEMRIALLDRKNQAEGQIETCQSMLETIGAGTFSDLSQVLGFLDSSLSRIVNQKYIWLETHRQTFALQKCRELESDVRKVVSDGLIKLSQGDHMAIEGIVAELNRFLPSKGAVAAYQATLPSDKDLLLLTQGS